MNDSKQYKLVMELADRLKIKQNRNTIITEIMNTDMTYANNNTEARYEAGADYRGEDISNRIE